MNRPHIFSAKVIKSVGINDSILKREKEPAFFVIQLQSFPCRHNTGSKITRNLCFKINPLHEFMECPSRMFYLQAFLRDYHWKKPDLFLIQNNLEVPCLLCRQSRP